MWSLLYNDSQLWAPYKVPSFMATLTLYLQSPMCDVSWLIFDVNNMSVFASW